MMRRLISFALFVALWIGSLATALHAQTSVPDWKAILKGVDGVVVYCLAAKDREYHEQMCGKLSQAAIAAFDGSGLKAVHTGVVYTGVDVQPGDPTDPAPFKQAPGITSPLVIRFLIKGTKSNNPGVAYAITVSRPFRAAIESGASGPGLSGDLVFSDQHWVAEGPRRKVVSTLMDYGAEQVRALVEEIRKGL